MILMIILTGCSENSLQQSSDRGPDGEKREQFIDKHLKPHSEITVAGPDSVTVTLQPQQPRAGDCLFADVKGKPANRALVWMVNGINVQEDQSNRYCLEDVRRDDIVTVTVGDGTAAATASVTVANSPPQIIDSRIELIVEDAQSYFEVTPEIVDADEDDISLEYQWLINGVQYADYSGSRLPAFASRQGDEVQVRILPADPYAKGPVYETRSFNVPGVAPIIISRPPLTFEAMKYLYQVAATNSAGGTLSFSLAEAPEGMSIDAENGMITWPLESIEPGVYQVKVVVADPRGNVANQAFTLNLGERTVE